MESLHAILRAGRIAANLKQEEAAAKLGLKSRISLSRFENGHEKPNVEMLKKMIETYGLRHSLKDLMSISIKPESALTDEEMALIRAFRNSEIDKAMDILASRVYGDAA